jgi:hypothetical protein
MVRVSWEKSTCAPVHLMHLPETCWRRVLDYLPASQTVPLLPLLRRHRSYYSGSHFRFPVAVAERDGEEEEKELNEEDEEIATEDESAADELEVVQEVSLTSLYDVVPAPPGVPTGRLRLHPQALLMVR